MSDKTLVEKLRDEYRCSTCLPVCLENILGIKFECHEMECSECHSKAYNALADAIEREYLPRPRYEDGEPVQFGDATKLYGATLNHVAEIDFYENGRIRIKGTSATSTSNECISEFCCDAKDRLKRPAPEVLDADGVPIKVGDTLWNLCNGVKVVADGLRDGGFYSSIGGDYTRNPRVFSHRQPDSLERIEEDAGKSVCEYFSRKIGDCENCEGFGGCREKMMRNLLRRQRTLLENK